jgi:aminoglycoside phosphotransferase (APT) family kinase protein
MDPSASQVERFLCWATQSSVAVRGIVPLAGGVHQNFKVEGIIDGHPGAWLIRRASSAEARFARAVKSYDLEREYRVLFDLQHTSLRVPRVCGWDSSGSYLSRPAFVEEFLDGPTVFESASPNLLERFAATLVRMNSVRPREVPSLAPPPQAGPDELVAWLSSHEPSMPPLFRRALATLAQTQTSARPQPAFTNGDLNPANFIVLADTTIAVVDWEFVGWTDPLMEILLLRFFPEDRPFLDDHPLDRIYCRLAGLSEDLLPWYELHAALHGWVYAMRDQQPIRAEKFGQRTERLLDRYRRSSA